MYSEQDLSKLIGEVEKEFNAHLAKAEEALAKSESANAEAAATETAPAAEAAPAATAAEAPLAKAEDEKKDEDKCDYDEKDHEEMHKMYKSMTKAERKAHMDAISKCGEISMHKSEEQSGEAKVEPVVDTSKEVELLKSEFSAKLAAEEAKSAELKKNLDAVSEFLTKLVKKTAPQGKAITNLDSVAKSEPAKEDEKPLTKSEINTRLAKKAAEPSLAKSDRDAINAFYLHGADIKTVSHLLK